MVDLGCDNVNDDLIIKKIKRIKLYKNIDMFLRIILTLFGSISFVSILMFLNSRFGVSYFKCFVITLFVSSIYSFLVNESLVKYNKKIRQMECEVENILKEENNELSKNDKLEIRFDKLSTDSKLMVLRYARDSLSMDLNDRSDVNGLNNEFMSVIELDENNHFDIDEFTVDNSESYTRSKKKSE